MSFKTSPLAVPLTEQWGQLIRAARIERGLSLEALAQRTGIAAGHLSRAERGQAGIGDEGRIALAVALHKQVADLFPYPVIDHDPERADGLDGAA